MANSQPFRFGYQDGKYGYIITEGGADTFSPFKANLQLITTSTSSPYTIQNNECLIIVTVGKYGYYGSNIHPRVDISCAHELIINSYNIASRDFAMTQVYLCHNAIGATVNATSDEGFSFINISELA